MRETIWPTDKTLAPEEPHRFLSLRVTIFVFNGSWRWYKTIKFQFVNTIHDTQIGSIRPSAEKAVNDHNARLVLKKIPKTEDVGGESDIWEQARTEDLYLSSSNRRFFTADLLACHSRKITDVNDNVDDECAPSG